MIITPPPAFESLTAGTLLVAGTGTATVLADMDFETYSEAGYIWSDALNKWLRLPGAPTNKKSIGIVGAAVYSEHPSTEVLCLAYDLKDGRGRRQWKPGDPLPADLFAHIRAGASIEAHNSGFEGWIWRNVCVKRMGWPPIAQHQFRCSMAKARAFALPGGLDDLSTVLDLHHKKHADGKRLLDKFSIPHSPTKKDPRRRIRPEDDPADAAKLYAYNLGDIAAEAEVSSRAPDLSPIEQELWICDQEINTRGVAVNTVAVENCIAIIEQAYVKYDEELRRLTGGVVEKGSQTERLKGWLNSVGVYLYTADANALIETLKQEGLHPDARRAIEIRQAIGSASVKKLYTIRNMTSLSGRLHDLFMFHTGRTGRWGGVDAQPQNLPKAGPALFGPSKKGFVCCGRWFGAHTHICPWCGVVWPPTEKSQEWNHHAIKDALQVVATRSLECVEMFFGDAVKLVSGCVRGLFISAPGHDLICSDYMAIEGVVTACLAGEAWRIEVFQTHGKIYEMSASKVSGISLEDFISYYAENGRHRPERQNIGKCLELACLGAATEVLTQRGYVPIIDVTTNDVVWDGEEWVTHQGLIPRGVKPTIDLDGVSITPDHQVICGHSWQEARQLDLNGNMLCSALATASASLPLCMNLRPEPLSYFARAARYLMRSVRTICAPESRRGAIGALERRAAQLKNYIGNMPRSYRMTNTVGDYSIASRLVSSGATILKMPVSKTTADVELKYGRNGEVIAGNFSRTSSLSKGGTAQNWTSTVKKLTSGINRAIFGLLPRKRIKGTGEKFKLCKNELKSWKPVYDLANAGPHHRFTIRTSSGHLIVHNCGFGGWVTATKAPNIRMDKYFTDEEIGGHIKAYRAASPNIVEFWGGQTRDKFTRNERQEYYGLEGMAVLAVMNPGVEYTYCGPHEMSRPVTYFMRGNVLYCRLPSGRHLTYHEPLLTKSDRPYASEWELQLSYMGWNSNPQKGPLGWVRLRTYGGSLVENVVQATARDILGWAIIKLSRMCYPIVMHVHDEIVAEVIEKWGSVEEFEAAMSSLPWFCVDWPIKAAKGWRAKEFRKE